MAGIILAVMAGLGFASNGCALDPAKQVAQYVHDRWEAEKGFPGGAVFAICQSQDGYLWIGTERGLVRFDGFEFTLIEQPIAGQPPTGPVRGLVTDADGVMWIRLDGPHLLLYRKGQFENAASQFNLRELAVTAMSLDREGKLMLWGPQNRLVRFRNEEFQKYQVSPDIPGIVISVAETQDHSLWMGTRDIGLFEVDAARKTTPSILPATPSVNALLPVEGGVWIGTETGLEFWDGQRLTKPASSVGIDALQILTLTRDRAGNVWVGTVRGLIRIDAAQAISTELLNVRRDDKHKADSGVTAIYEDRDGDIWFGGQHGIERLRDGMFTGYSVAQGMRAESNGPLYVDHERRTWFAPSSGGLYWMKDGHVSQVKAAGLEHDVIYSISGGDGEIWVGRQQGGLTVLKDVDRALIAKTYTQSDGLAQNNVYSVHRNRDGTVWAGTVSAGVSRLSNGVITNYSVGNGLASNAVFSIIEGHDGTMWLATASGLESYSEGGWKNYAASEGLPSSHVRSVFEDAQHVLWIATSDGLALFSKGRVEALNQLTDALREEVLGIAEDKQGSLWIATSDHVLAVNRDRLLAGSLSESDVQRYGNEDGLPGVEGVRRDRSVVADADGRIWVSLTSGLAMADPTKVAKEAMPVDVRIESISAGGQPVGLVDPLKFAAGTRSLTFNFADSNLSIPQRVRFRYRLDGSDQGWSNDVALRRVVYANLGPGTYLFHIVASNGLGAWNGPETTVHFVVDPRFWQTTWFRLMCFAALCLVVLALYQLRMYQLTRQLNMRFQERLAERSRIAQELHDTLLQGVLSASLQLDVAEDQLPEGSPTRPALRRILQLMAKVTEEGRNALRGLRAQEPANGGLETSFSRMRQEFALDEGVDYRVIVHSVARPLRPLVRDEVYRIGREALINAFVHAKAKSIEIEVEYASRHLRVLVRDDGCGIDPEVLHAGREGHWGLQGIRERSEGIGADLTLRSRLGSGTEIELTVPGETAFESAARVPIPRLLPWLSREKFETRAAGKKSEREKANKRKRTRETE